VEQVQVQVQVYKDLLTQVRLKLRMEQARLIYGDLTRSIFRAPFYPWPRTVANLGRSYESLIKSFRFHIMFLLFVIRATKCDRDRKSKPNFVLFDPVKITDGVGEMYERHLN